MATKNKASKVSQFEVERRRALETFNEDLLSRIESNKVAEQKEAVTDLEFEHQELSLENRREKKRIRGRWNKILTWLVILGFGFSYLMIALIGFGVMEFADNTFAVPSVVAAGVIQTYGLAKLAIKYFFSDDGWDAKK